MGPSLHADVRVAQRFREWQFYRDRTAIPESAAPLVHPRASWAPYTKNRPPRKAKINRLILEIFGDFSILNLSLLDIAPDKNPPATTPNISIVNQFFRGFFPSSKYLL